MSTIRRAAILLATAAISAAIPAIAHAQQAEGEAPRPARPRGEIPDREIIVTARSLASDNTNSPLPVQILAGDELAHRRQGGLGETLAGLPGVHLDSFGGGASRPVIRGQTVPRIEILSDGANLFDVSSVSPDHAITTDPLLLDAIELQRGPAAVRYGGNAMNGAVNLIDSKVPKAIPAGGVSGATELRYGTGDQERTLVGRVTAGVGQFAVHAEGAHRTAGNYNVPKSFGTDELRDSFADNTTYSLGASWIPDKGYIGAAYTHMASEYGLPGHSHQNGVCHTHGLDLHCEAHDQFDDPFGSSDDHTAFIRLRSERADLRADYDDLLQGLSHIRLRGSYTDYRHDEIDGPALFSRYTNQVWDGRLELTHRPLFGFTGTLGVQYTHGTFSGINVSDAHVPVAPNQFGYVRSTPDYITRNIGIFLSERRSFGNLDLEVAARKDWRRIDIPLPQWLEPFTDDTRAILVVLDNMYGGPGAYQRQMATIFNRNNPPSRHNPFSASFGAIWRIDDTYSLALSLARTERPAGVRELYAYGNNLATNSYEIGLANTRRLSSSLPLGRTDVMETTQSLDLTLRKTGGPLEFEIGLFYQDIDDYIFARLIEAELESGLQHNLLVYTAADARFAGVDGQISYSLTPQSRLTLFGDYVDTRLKDQNDNLPRIPPGRLGARYEHTAGPLSGDVEYTRTFAQNTIASYETCTPGYNLLNATLSYRVNMGNTGPAEIYLRATNLLNELAFVHTSFVKNQSPMRGRSVAVGMRYSW
ncbi:TonB-dependent receptor [Altererythrobacter xixiisoli]|uniref:TonB-dependent receptor n=2 Tax=Croceibacterium xixiisoli TaxID=1476466 RepID=A0A6I4TS74_9SPHN|nr:TonB-dependent receptor [Croceibacterium xixiisoli]